MCGDVLFCGSDDNEKQNRLIQHASAGGYVHCALYIGDGRVVDVVRSGIRKTPFNTFLSQYQYIAVARCPGNDEFPIRRKKILKFAQNALEGGISGYNYLGAILSPIKELADLKNMDILWKLSHNSGEAHNSPSKRSFCSEFIIETYVACGYIDANDSYISPARRTPSGLAEENIFNLQGYMSKTGWKGISREDHFLGGQSWVLSKKGRERLQQQEIEMRSFIKKHSRKAHFDKNDNTDYEHR